MKLTYLGILITLLAPMAANAFTYECRYAPYAPDQQYTERVVIHGETANAGRLERSANLGAAGLAYDRAQGIYHIGYRFRQYYHEIDGAAGDMNHYRMYEITTIEINVVHPEQSYITIQEGRDSKWASLIWINDYEELPHRSAANCTLVSP